MAPAQCIKSCRLKDDVVLKSLGHEKAPKNEQELHHVIMSAWPREKKRFPTSWGIHATKD